jgi:hypothetical protein
LTLNLAPGTPEIIEVKFFVLKSPFLLIIWEILWSLLHLRNILDRLQHPKFQLNWSNTCNFTRSFYVFYIARSKMLRWAWSRPGLMVPWAKMMLFNGRFKMDWWTLKEMGK